MIVTYLHHSSFMIELNDSVLIFDAFKNVDLIPQNKPIYVFASHWHRDHFSFSIFTQFPTAHYILSDDIRKKYNKNYFLRHDVTEAQYESIIFIKPDCHIKIDQLDISTTASTDSGVTFLVKTENRTIFHAGDLNNWQWEDDTPEEIQAMTTVFEREIHKLKAYSIDLAMFPCDPRLNQNAALGIDTLMNTLSVTYVLPMHLWDQLDYIQTLKDKPWFDKVLDYSEIKSFHLS